MRIIAVIDEEAVIRRILKHLRLWNPAPEPPEHPARDPPSATAPGVALPPAHPRAGFALHAVVARR